MDYTNLRLRAVRIREEVKRLDAVWNEVTRSTHASKLSNYTVHPDSMVGEQMSSGASAAAQAVSGVVYRARKQARAKLAIVERLVASSGTQPLSGEYFKPYVLEDLLEDEE